MTEPVGPGLDAPLLPDEEDELELLFPPPPPPPPQAVTSVAATAVIAAAWTSRRLVVVLTGIRPLSRRFARVHRRRVPQSEAVVTVGRCDPGYKTIRKILHRIVLVDLDRYRRVATASMSRS